MRLEGERYVVPVTTQGETWCSRRVDAGTKARGIEDAAPGPFPRAVV